MDYRKKFLVEPGHRANIDDFDPGYTGKHISEDRARDEIEKSRGEMAAQQYLPYTEKKHALLIVLQRMDAAGKDGTVSHVMSAMNPQGHDGECIRTLQPKALLESSIVRTMKTC